MRGGSYFLDMSKCTFRALQCALRELKAHSNHIAPAEATGEEFIPVVQVPHVGFHKQGRVGQVPSHEGC